MIEVISIALDESHLKRLRTATEFIHVTSQEYICVDDVILTEMALTPKLILVSVMNVSTREEVAGQVQTIKQFFPDSFILVLAQKKMSAAEASFVKKSGGNFVMLSFDFLSTVQLEYILCQVVKANFVPVGTEDLKVGTKVGFTLYAKLALNNKIVPVVQPGTEINQARIDKLKSTGDLQVRRGQIELFSKYINENRDDSLGGMARRCSAQLQAITNLHTNLVLLLLDQGEQGSFDQGRDLLSKFNELCAQLLKDLKSVTKVWEIFDQAVFETLGQVDRSVIVASLAAMTSLRTGVGVAQDILMAGLFCDIGMLLLSPKSLGRLNRIEDRNNLDAEDALTYKSHPTNSLRILLERKIQISERIKEIILCTHEQANRQGFPNMIIAEKIPVESSIILFHEFVDLEWRSSKGKGSLSFPVIWQNIYKRECESPGYFTVNFIQKILWRVEKMREAV